MFEVFCNLFFGILVQQRSEGGANWSVDRYFSRINFLKYYSNLEMMKNY